MSAGRKNNANKKDWNTPPKYVRAIEDVLGKIELDPCSNEHSLINSEVKYILPVDGLQLNWDYKTIFVNPPYGRDSERKTSIFNWIQKAVESRDLNNNEILMLIPVATNTKHFKELIFKHSTAICFLNDTRLKFWSNSNEDKKGAPMACCMVYFGDNFLKFNEVFKKHGKIFKI